MASNVKKIINRYWVVVFAMLLICVAIGYRAVVTVVVERDAWKTKMNEKRVVNIERQANRGNIYSDDGRIMASDIPQYYIFIDLVTANTNFKIGKGKNKKEIKFSQYIDSLSVAMSQKFGDRSPKEYREYIKRGFKQKNKKYYPLYPHRISFTDLQEVKKFPWLSFPDTRSGLVVKKMDQRKKPFNSLAARTIGDIYGEKNRGGKNGLELSYDSLLRGTPGTSIRKKMGKYMVTIDERPPVDGLDIVSTINIDIQDITEQSLKRMLKKVDAAIGIAIVMEVATGEIKAITNMARINNGEYGETKNHAVADELEPGSTFKTVAMMAALDDGVVSPDDVVDVGNGVMPYAGKAIRDHNWRNGVGYQKITAAKTMWYSSNVGIAKIILKGYEHNPARFVEKLYKMNINTPLELEIPGTGKPTINHPLNKNWSKTTLPWMSFGYETQLPPIYTLTFYNAIANGGKMIKPIFVKAITENGEVLKDLKTTVINDAICKPKTLQQIQQMLREVVLYGTAQDLKSDVVSIAGKTGTAQISEGGKYSVDGVVKHRVSFCGYFPAENPQYSCMVVIIEPRIGYPSGGKMAGVVLKEIAEQIYARTNRLPLSQLVDTDAPKKPVAVSPGRATETLTALSMLNIPAVNKGKGIEWVTPQYEQQDILFTQLPIVDSLTPSVIGMGLRDAIYLLENSGYKVLFSGFGKVVAQSIYAGTPIVKGNTITLQLNR